MVDARETDVVPLVKRIERLLPVDFERHESQTIKDSALRNRTILAQKIARMIGEAAMSGARETDVDDTIAELRVKIQGLERDLEAVTDVADSWSGPDSHRAGSWIREREAADHIRAVLTDAEDRQAVADAKHEPRDDHMVDCDLFDTDILPSSRRCTCDPARLTYAETREIAATFHGTWWLSYERVECIERILANRVQRRDNPLE